MRVRDLFRKRLVLALVAGSAVAAEVPRLPEVPDPAALPVMPMLPDAPVVPASANLPIAPEGVIIPASANIPVPLENPVPVLELAPVATARAEKASQPPVGAELPPLVLPTSATTVSPAGDTPPSREVAPSPKPVASTSTVPVAPVVPAVPSVPAALEAPKVPSVPTVPATPVTPPTPVVPVAPAVPVAPVVPDVAPVAPVPVPEAKDDLPKPMVQVIRETPKIVPAEPEALPKPPEKVQAKAPATPTPTATPEAPKVTGPASTNRSPRYEEVLTRPSSITVQQGEAKVLPAVALDRAVLEARTALAKVRDYSCHYLFQERGSQGLSPEHTAELYGRTNPRSVAMRVIAPQGAAGAETVYVASRNAGQVRVKPAGAYGAMAWRVVDTSDSRATLAGRHSAATIGIPAVMERLERLLTVEQQLRNPLSVLQSEYVYAGRPVTRFEIVAERSHALRYAHTVVVYMDQETKLPVRFEAYDTPKASQIRGDMLECHSFVNVRVNPGVGDSVFDR